MVQSCHCNLRYDGRATQTPTLLARRIRTPFVVLYVNHVMLRFCICAQRLGVVVAAKKQAPRKRQSRRQPTQGPLPPGFDGECSLWGLAGSLPCAWILLCLAVHAVRPSVRFRSALCPVLQMIMRRIFRSSHLYCPLRDPCHKPPLPEHGGKEAAHPQAMTVSFVAVPMHLPPQCVPKYTYTCNSTHAWVRICSANNRHTMT